MSREVKEKTFGFIITALSLVAGLAWNEAIQSLINNFFTLNKNSVLAKFVYAIILTLALTLITIYLAKVFGQENKEEKNNIK
ncbi:MAG: hypothetical protein HYV53_02580 [Parcubacteria group bacterium]|nr:hypothetical protein [Parcubacteria group bacterium]